MTRVLKLDGGAAFPSEDAVFIAGSPIANADAAAMGANVTRGDFQNILRAHLSAPGASVILRPVTGGSATYADASNVLSFNVYSEAFWEGGTAEIWRMENGDLSMIRTATIAAATNTRVTFADSGVAPQDGDMLILRKVIDQPGDYLADERFHGEGGESSLRFAPYSPAFKRWLGDDPHDKARWLQENGDWYVEYDLSLTVQNNRDIDLLRFHGAGGNFYYIPTIGRTYRVTVDMRADAARTASLRLVPSGYVARVVAIDGAAVDTTFPVDLSLTTARQTFTVDFVFDAIPAGSTVGYLNVVFDQAGRYDLFDFAVFEADAPLRGLGARQIAIFGDAALDHIRDHSFVKTDRPGRAYDLRRLIRDWLHASLANTVALGIPRFWLQPELYLIHEAAELVEYLVAPAGSGPWADLRASLGRTAPWIDDLHILFEISNETWNSAGSFYNFVEMKDAATGQTYSPWDGVIYGKFFQKFIDAMKAAPAWSPAADTAFTFVIGGRFNSDYGDVAARHAPDATIVTRAPYARRIWETGGGENLSNSQGFLEILFWGGTVTPMRLENNDTWLAAARANGANPALVGGTYEDAVSYADFPPNIPDGDIRFARTKAAGVGWLDKIVRQASRYSLQSFFAFGAGAAWHSHHQATLEPYPKTLWTKVWNTLCAGALHETFRLRAPVRTVEVNDNDYDADEIACHVTSNGSRRSIILINRNLPYSALETDDPFYDAGDDGSRTVRVKLPWASAASLTRHHMNGDFNSQVWDPTRDDYATFAVTADALGAHTGDLVVTLPAAEAEVYVFEGVG